jgi:hypothetical protein
LVATNEKAPDGLVFGDRNGNIATIHDYEHDDNINRAPAIRVLEVRVTAFSTSKIHLIKKTKKNAPLCTWIRKLIPVRINTWYNHNGD